MDTPSSFSPLAALARLWWIFFGPAFLLMLLWDVTLGGGWMTASDIAFLAVLAVIVVGRLYEFKRGHALDSMGEPVTETDVRQYIVRTLAIGLGLWLLANVVGNLWLVKEGTL